MKRLSTLHKMALCAMTIHNDFTQYDLIQYHLTK
jgi:hypothetical protein